MIECLDAGTVPYATAAKWQEDLSARRRKGEIPDRILLLEHLPVITLGRRNATEDVLFSSEEIQARGIDFHRTDRGGRATYHGPGQLIGYFIFRLGREPIPSFVWKVEEGLIRFLEEINLAAERDPEFPGVWIGQRKIAALGLHVAHGVTTHGFALNVTCDLKPFSYIVPCGIQGREVTSVEKELGWRPSPKDVKDKLLGCYAKVFRERVSLKGIVPTPPE